MRRCFFFFFQAEDGIRDLVTGVQTCALPILLREAWGGAAAAQYRASPGTCPRAQADGSLFAIRSPALGGEPGAAPRAGAPALGRRAAAASPRLGGVSRPHFSLR